MEISQIHSYRVLGDLLYSISLAQPPHIRSIPKGAGESRVSLQPYPAREASGGCSATAVRAAQLLHAGYMGDDAEIIWGLYRDDREMLRDWLYPN